MTPSSSLPVRAFLKAPPPLLPYFPPSLPPLNRLIFERGGYARAREYYFFTGPAAFVIVAAGEEGPDETPELMAAVMRRD